MENLSAKKIRLKRKGLGRYKSVTDSANYLGVSKSIFYELVRRGTFTLYLPFKPLAQEGKKSNSRFDTFELDAYMESNKIPKIKEA